MDPAANSPADGERREWRLPDGCGVLVRELFAQSLAERWHLSFQSFQAALTRSAAKRFAGSAVTSALVQEYFAALHIKDLALACACADGSENAWTEVVAGYRGY